MDPVSDSHLDYLYDIVKPIIWVIKIQYRDTTEASYLTGFSVDGDGLLMTCVSKIPFTEVVDIKVRRLKNEGFSMTASIVYIFKECGIVLMKTEPDGLYRKFSDNGTLSVGQTLVYVGNSNELVGSLFVGRAAYKCVDDVAAIDSHLECVQHVASFDIAPRYRTMGDVFNVDFFELRMDDVKYDFLKSLDPRVPIIQCSGFEWPESCAGGPIFDTNGAIVGIVLIMDTSIMDTSYQVAIHVSYLKLCLRKYRDRYDSRKQPEAGGVRIKDSSRQGKRKLSA